MVLVHRVLRREFGRLPRLFRAVDGDRARSEVIGAHAREMLTFLHLIEHLAEEERDILPIVSITLTGGWMAVKRKAQQGFRGVQAGGLRVRATLGGQPRPSAVPRHP
ncbi:hypothetical protein ABZ456_22350 [Streptomyces sp. NPDC005776]|uniref:hypothetical protein n=1 Tax=Streptomyces sp. NPDC005776 TaxID=3154676 RepID=UPI0033CBF4A6